MSKHGTILKTGEAESRTINTVDTIVTLHHVTEWNKATPVVCDWSFDFAGVSSSKIMELASRSLVIDCRNAWKKQTVAIATSDAQTKQTFLVTDLLSKQKRGKTVAEKVGALVQGMTPEQIAAIIAEATK